MGQGQTNSLPLLHVANTMRVLTSTKSKTAPAQTLNVMTWQQPQQQNKKNSNKGAAKRNSQASSHLPRWAHHTSSPTSPRCKLPRPGLFGRSRLRLRGKKPTACCDKSPTATESSTKTKRNGMKKVDFKDLQTKFFQLFHWLLTYLTCKLIPKVQRVML